MPAPVAGIHVLTQPEDVDGRAEPGHDDLVGPANPSRWYKMSHDGFGGSMTRRLFGTDGIRGTANSEPMTAETALKVAMAAGFCLRRGDHRHLVVIGKDTRLSGYLIEPALTAGFIAMGMDVVLVGPLPTPAIAMLTRSLRADLGVVISASHNPFEDNGVKLFGPDGYKLSDEIEAQIEGQMADVAAERAPPHGLGRAKRLDDAGGRYIEFVKGSFPRGLRLDGLKVVVDCANGAAYRVAPTVLWELGAEVIPLGVSPDGLNINRDCGTMATTAMQRAVVAQGAHLGIALDGDADRLLIADEGGRLLDGDQLMALMATQWHGSGRLAAGGVVATVMSNLGFERHLGRHVIKLTRTAVGDRYVVEAMRRIGSNLGGEQSGHIILGEFSTTGDGLIAALQVLAAIVETGAPASEVLNVFTPVPQLLRNVRYAGGQPLEARPVKAAIKAGERRLGSAGRLLVRKSGTEPLIRIMAEGEDETLVAEVVEEIAGAVLATAGAEESAAQ
jgi:phosphoglucosamine mutase